MVTMLAKGPEDGYGSSGGRRLRGERASQARGLRVILVLAALTLVEYLVAVAVQSSAGIWLLTPMALAKAWLIVTYFMHVARVWRGEEAEE